MPSRGSGHGVPQERHQKKIVLTRKYVPEDLAEDYAQEKFQNKIVIAWKYLPEALPGSPPMNGSRTRSFLPRNASQRLWPGCPPGKALELPGSAFKRLRSEGPRREGVAWNPGESQNEGLEVQAKRKCTRGNPLGL